MSTFFVVKARSMAACAWIASPSKDLPDFCPVAPLVRKRPQRSVTLRDLNADLDPGLWRAILKGLDAAPEARVGGKAKSPAASPLSRPASSPGGPGVLPGGQSTATLPPPLHLDLASESAAATSKGPSGAQCPGAHLQGPPALIDRSVYGRTRLSSISESPKVLEDVMEGASGINGRGCIYFYFLFWC